MLKRLVAGLFLSALLTASAWGATTMTTFSVTSAAWVDLGAGPMTIQPRARGQIFLGFGVAAPATTDDGFLVSSSGPPVVYAGSNHAWARAQSTTLPVIVGPSADGVFPAGMTPLSASSGNVAAASAVATLAGAANVTTYITGFRCGGAGATAASVVNLTVAGLLGGTQTYTVAVPAGATLAGPTTERRYQPAVPASAVNTAIVVTMPSLGAGNTNASCNAEGYQG